MFPNATRMLRRELECSNGFWTLPILGPGCSTRKGNAPHVTGLIRIWLGCIFGNKEVPFFFFPAFPAVRQKACRMPFRRWSAYVYSHRPSVASADLIP
jgi:hypothetical protein